MWLCGNGMLLAWFLAARSRPGESVFAGDWIPRKTPTAAKKAAKVWKVLRGRLRQLVAGREA